MTFRRIDKHTTAIVLAGGAGSRMNLDKTKQKIEILGKSVLRRAVEPFEACSFIDEIIVVCRRGELQFAKSEMQGITKLSGIVIGGKTRAESAINGFSAIKDKSNGYVLIHDSARCLVSCRDIESVANAAYEHGCATASCLVYDTVKTVDNNGTIISTVPRETLRTVQTPQAFSCELYSRAVNRENIDFDSITDDNMLMENICATVYAVETDRSNIKITNPADIEYAEYILQKREKDSKIT